MHGSAIGQGLDRYIDRTILRCNILSANGGRIAIKNRKSLIGARLQSVLAIDLDASDRYAGLAFAPLSGKLICATSDNHGGIYGFSSVDYRRDQDPLRWIKSAGMQVFAWDICHVDQQETVICLLRDGNLLGFDVETGEKVTISGWPKTNLCSVNRIFARPNVMAGGLLVYAGDDGVEAYSIRHKTPQFLRKYPVAIAVSQDGLLAWLEEGNLMISEHGSEDVSVMSREITSTDGKVTSQVDTITFMGERLLATCIKEMNMPVLMVSHGVGLQCSTIQASLWENSTLAAAQGRGRWMFLAHSRACNGSLLLCDERRVIAIGRDFGNKMTSISPDGEWVAMAHPENEFVKIGRVDEIFRFLDDPEVLGEQLTGS